MVIVGVLPKSWVGGVSVWKTLSDDVLLSVSGAHYIQTVNG
jgi:hypothetical protein